MLLIRFNHVLNQGKFTERLMHSKMGMVKVKNFEEEFDFKPKIMKDKYYVTAKERRRWKRKI